MKKPLKVLALSLVMVAAGGALSACGSKSKKVDEPNNNEPVINEPVKTYYTVTFNANDGSEVKAVQVESGAKATKPTDPTKEYYNFKGWYTDEALTKAFDFTQTAITANITLYAKWEKADIEVTYAKAYEGPYVSYTTSNYTTGAAVKDDLVALMVGASEGTEYEATRAGVDDMVADADVLYGDSKKYVITLADSDVAKIDEYADAYLAKYAADTENWAVVPDTDGDAYFTSTTARDVMVSYNYSSSAKTITIYVFSFKTGAIAAAMQEGTTIEISNAIDWDINKVDDYESYPASTKQVVKNQLKAIILGSEAEGDLADMIDSLDNNIINEDESSKYVLTIQTTSIEDYSEDYRYTDNSDEENPVEYTGLQAYYEEFLADYNQKYVDAEWESMTKYIPDAEGVYYTTIDGKDVLVSAEYHTETTSITIYVLSFAEGSIETSMQAMLGQGA